MKLRADLLLVQRGLVESRTRAQAVIAAGHVTSAGRAIEKPSEMLAEDVDLELSGDALRYVSRGTLKLKHALDEFGLSPDGLIALDLGASTGGFTEILLERGAAHVYAVDVGHDQLHPKLRADPRVTNLEGMDARALTLPEMPRFITADLSFIGLEKALPRSLALAAPGAVLVALIKPQFEAGPGAVGKGGIVRDETARDAAVSRISAFMAAQPEWSVLGITQSPITGGDGNVEFLIAAQREG